MNAHFPHGPVAVAVSGGADSLYTLISLKEAGVPVFALHGIFAQRLAQSVSPSSGAAAPEAEASPDATLALLAEACKALDVPLHIADCEAFFTARVIRPFVESYARGHTPNPCALCNAVVKFGLLQDKALALGAEYLATGHYARLVPAGPARNETSADAPGLALLQGSDPFKDQSYFLALVPPARLARALFPMGRLRKKAVLATLAQRGISVPQPGESQEVCFVPGDDYRTFLPHMAARLNIALPGPGPMLLRDGRRIGTHRGLWRYTEGQRKGLGIGWSHPLHVLGKEHADNILRLGLREELHVEECLCREVNILLSPEQWPDIVYVKTRYRENPRPAHVRLVPSEQDGQSLHIRFFEPETAVASGQIAAVYIPTGLAPDSSAENRCGEGFSAAPDSAASGAIREAAALSASAKSTSPAGAVSGSGMPDLTALRLVAGGIIR